MADISNVIGAFSADHVVRLTGLTKRQLEYWDKTGFFSPQYTPRDKVDSYGRVYSFRDVVGLRTLSILRKMHRIPLQRLRKFAEKLDNSDTELWSKLVFYVLDRDVYFEDEASGFAQNADGQTAPIVLMQDVINDVASKVESLRERSSSQFGHIERHRNTMRNASVIAGTRIPTAAIRRFSEAGYSIDDILREYPSLTKKDVLAALKHEETLAESA